MRQHAAGGCSLQGQLSRHQVGWQRCKLEFKLQLLLLLLLLPLLQLPADFRCE
jgi:hypothetical protein